MWKNNRQLSKVKKILHQINLKKDEMASLTDAELAGKGWTAEDIELMKQLSAKGLELSITGGIVPEEIHLFKEVKNAKAFIAGRALVGEKGKQTAEAIRAEIDKYWA